VRAGISRVVTHPIFADANGEQVRCGYDATLGPEPFGGARLAALARPVLADMARALSGGRTPLDTVPLLVAMPEPRPGFDSKNCRNLLHALGDERTAGTQKFDVRGAGSGHAGTLAAVAEAATHLARGEWELAVVAGVDSYLDGYALDWLEENRRLDREGIRGGLSHRCDPRGRPRRRHGRALLHPGRPRLGPRIRVRTQLARPVE
jgi:3-oxoacyl-[acyl-carrier-protein] synthase-1